MAYWSEPPHATLSQTERFVRRTATEATPRRYFVIEHESRAIGTGGFWHGDELGYILHPALWRQGLGNEVLRALIGYGFSGLGLAQITADADPRNAASLAMLRKAGFEETGRDSNTIEVGGVWVDSVYLRLPSP